MPRKGWHTVRRMPATVLEVLQDDGTYPNLYYGKNLLDEVPQDLYKQDWWYRTSFTAPAGHSTYLLEFPGINYRAEVWLNGRLVADNTQIVGMFDAHELDVGRWLRPGESNTLAIKVTPERALQDIDGVELADSWWDWINWKYLGYQGPDKDVDRGNSFVSDRNAGIWKPVYLKVAGDGGPRAGRCEHRITPTANRFRPADCSYIGAQLLVPTASRHTEGHDLATRQAEHQRRAGGHLATRRAARGHLQP